MKLQKQIQWPIKTADVLETKKKVWTHFQASRYILPKRKQRGDKTRNGSDCNKLDKILSFEKIGS